VEDHFELRLRRLFADVHEDLPNDEFELNVRRRVERIRRARFVAQALALVALAVAAYAVAPLVGVSIDYVAESSVWLTDALGNFGATPVAFAVGIASAVYALFDLRLR